MKGRAYALFKRPTDAKNRAKRAAGRDFKGTWYVQYKLPNGKWSSAKSTGTSNRVEAESYAQDYIAQGQIVVRERVRVRDVADGFYDWPGGVYAQNRIATGKRFSERWAKEKRDMVRREILPRLGDMLLTDIDKRALQDFRNAMLADGLTGNSVNKVLVALNSILEYAVDSRYMQAVARIEKAADRPERRGILLPDEVRKLFSAKWDDERCRVANLLAASTGLRQGEIVGLQHGCVHKDHLQIEHSWSTHGLKDTKSGESRFVPLASRVYAELARLVKQNPFDRSPESFVFWGSAPQRPIEARELALSLYKTMERIGISEAQRTERKIVFHGWRAFFNSLLVDGRIPGEKIRATVGHASERMTSAYYRPSDYADIVEIVDSMVGKG